MAAEVFVKVLDSVDSTNRYVRDGADALWHEAVVCNARMVAVTARSQTAGRGQRGNVWISEDGKNILLSLLLRMGDTIEVARQFCLSQTIAVALHRTILHYGVETRLKWPNDIYVGHCKIAGVLVELDFSGQYIEQAIIGVGLNVNQEVFPPIDRVPVSMKMLLGKDFLLQEVLNTLLDEFGKLFDELLNGGRESIAAEYDKLLLGYAERYRYKDSSGEFFAVVEGVEPSGQLLLRRDNGTLSRYSFREIEQIL